MKKIALIFVCIFCVGFCCACSNMQKQKEAKETMCKDLEYVVGYLNDNYEDYNFTRYISFGIGNLINEATEEEKDTMLNLVGNIKQAIVAGENLESEDMETPTGAAEYVFDLDELLFSIWYRAVN